MSWIHERVEVHRTEVQKVCRYYLKYDKRFRRLRPDKPACDLCQTKFKDGDDFNIAFTSKGNKLICQTCTDTAEENGTEVVLWPKGNDSTASPSDSDSRKGV